MEKDFDKVYEVYMGSDEAELTIKTRKRIQWICDQVTGERVLDVGCSQGITSILLGRKNKKVLALDIVEESIEFAKQKLEKEEEYVRENVKFMAGDFMACGFNDQKYDTIIMTEVLEHIADVQPFIQKIMECIEQTGRIIITVPFGINDYWDHKRTYYFGTLYEQLEKIYKIINVQFMGKWLGVVAQPKNEEEIEETVKIDLDLMLREEESFFTIERYLVDENNRYKDYIQKQKERINDLVQREKNFKEKIERLTWREHELKEKVEERSEKVRQVILRQNELKEKISLQQEQIDALRGEVKFKK